VVEDRGHPKYIKWINDDTIRIDIYMENKSDAIKFGVKKMTGYIIK
jgi:3D (Asp-Asp-Asp) domain-containing protein